MEESVLKENFTGDFHRRNGGGQTRTGGDRSRWIYSPLQLPLCDTPHGVKNCWRKELNPQPSDYKSGALPIELLQQIGETVISNVRFLDQHLPFQGLGLHLLFLEMEDLPPFCRGFF